MNNVSGHIAILAGAAASAYGLAVLVHPGQRSETAASAHAPVVVVLPRRAAPEPAAPSPPVQAPRPSATPRDRASLARQLQAELQRVGCYAGDINGAWTSRTRAAMKSFTDRVNATLPTDKPDYILLALVQSHRQPVCGTGETPPPTPILATAPKLLAPPKRVTPAARADPRPEPPRAQEPAPAAPVPRPARSARQDHPVPAVGVRQRRPRRARRPSPPARYARSLLSSLKRAATALSQLP